MRYEENREGGEVNAEYATGCCGAYATKESKINSKSVVSRFHQWKGDRVAGYDHEQAYHGCPREEQSKRWQLYQTVVLFRWIVPVRVGEKPKYALGLVSLGMENGNNGGCDTPDSIQPEKAPHLELDLG